MDRHLFLAALHNLLQPRGYVEIGVQTGASLRLAQCPALGIDPALRLAYPLPPTARLAQMTSDEFFALPESTQRGMGLPEHVDLAFIDGLHLHEQALRDFANVERLANERTVVVFDDVLPRSQAEAVRDPAGPGSAAKVSTGEVAYGDWTGDVWKVHRILVERMELTLTLVDTQPTGVLLVSGLDPDNGPRWQPIPWAGGDEVPAYVLKREYAVAPEEALSLIAEGVAA